MRKRCTLYTVLIILWSLANPLNAQIYQIQVAAFTESINHSYFDYAGYNKVYAERDHNNFVRYTLGEFFTKETANQALKDVRKKGFSNAYIQILDEPMYAYSGDSPILPLKKVPEKEELYIRSVQFSATELSLDKELLFALEEALSVMQEYPSLKLRIVGHTDDIGDKRDNNAISKKRARIIRNFLLANGIPAYRLKMRISEEPSPAVYFEGKGLPKTRDYNRRIIITLVDLKDEIVVNNLAQKRPLQNTWSSLDKTVQLMKFIKLA